MAASIRRARQQAADSPSGSEEEQLWADIAEAYLLFLTRSEAELTADPSVLVQAYRDTIPSNRRFAWDATRGQLELFAQLGHRTDAVDAVTETCGDPASTEPARQERLVVFGGHRIDPPGHPARFPAAAEAAPRW